MKLVIEYPGGSLLFDPAAWRWSVRGRVEQKVRDAALQATKEYRYSAAHGYPGYTLAARVAKQTGGKTRFPPVPPIPEGAIA